MNVPKRTLSTNAPTIQSFSSQPIGIRTSSAGNSEIKPKDNVVKVKFQKLSVTDDFTNEFVNSSDSFNNATTKIKKSKKDSDHFDEICEIDQIAILPFIPVKFNRS